MELESTPLYARPSLSACVCALLTVWLAGCAATPQTTASAVAATPETGSGPVSSATLAEIAAASADAGPTRAEPARGKGGPGWLGVELAKRDGGEPGVLIRGVMHGSPAERAGLSAGDVVLSVDGANVARPIELHDLIVSAGANKRVSIGVLRSEAPRLFAVQLEAVPDDDEVMRKTYIGSPAPDFGGLQTVQGSVTPSLPALQGRVVVLEFWASWCAVCHVMAPTLNGWHDRYSAQGLTVLGVTNDPVEIAGRTASEFGMGYALASDGSGSTLRAYRAFALPTLFVIDKRGKVRDVLIGYSTPRLREIETLVRKLIAEG